MWREPHAEVVAQRGHERVGRQPEPVVEIHVVLVVEAAQPRERPPVVAARVAPAALAAAALLLVLDLLGGRRLLALEHLELGLGCARDRVERAVQLFLLARSRAVATAAVGDGVVAAARGGQRTAAALLATR